MTTSLIRPTSASFDQILEDLTNHVRTNSEGGWKDFSVSSAGNVVMELLSGLGAFLHHDVMTARRETLLEAAKLRSSIVGMAQLMGYPVRRKSAPKIKMVINVSSQTFISRTQEIGVFRSMPICPLADQSLSPNVDNVVYCAIGSFKEHNFELQTAGDFAKYLLRNPKIENDLYYYPESGIEFPLLELGVDVKEAIGQQVEEFTNVQLVEYAEQLTSNSCLIKTHLDGIILIFGDNIFGRRAFLTDKFKLTYLTSEGLLVTPSITELERGFTCHIGTLKRVELLFPGSNEDSTEKIRLALTKYNAARRRMVTIDDHKSILMSYKGIISANAQPSDTAEAGGCCSVDLTCLLEGGARLDASSNVVLDPVGTQTAITIPFNSTTITYQSSDLHPSSILLPQNGFTNSLSTGTPVWVKITPNPGKTEDDIPQGLMSNQFYYIIRIPNSQNIRLATDKFKAIFGTFVQISPPSTGNSVDCTLEMSIYQDTAKTADPLGSFNVTYETESTIASSVRVSSSMFTTVQTGDALYVTYSSGANPVKNLNVNTYYYAIRLAIGESYRFRFALDRNRAELNDRIQLDYPINGQDASGSVTINRRVHREEFTIGTSNVFLYNPENPSEPGYIDLSNASDTLKGFLSPTPFKVMIKTATGGTVLPGGIQNGGTYWAFNPSSLRMSLAATKTDAEADPPVGVPLTDPGSQILGKIYIDVFDAQEETISITPASQNVVYEAAQSYSSSIDLTDASWKNDLNVDFYAGMKVRLYSESSTLVLPDGLQEGEFYYIIPIPGTRRIRFASTPAKATGADNVPVEYIPLTPPSSGNPIGGYLSLDFFLDYATFNLTSQYIYYNQVSDYLNSVDVGNSRLTGNSSFPYGYSTGTKIKFTGTTFPGGLNASTFFYLIRIPGTTKVRFATTKSRAVRGISVLLEDTGTINSTATVTVYGTPEEDALREYLEEFRVAGEQIHFVDPTPVILDIKVNVVISYSSVSQSVLDGVISVLDSYTNQLSSVFNIGRVVKQISDLPGVLRVYLEKPLSDRVLAFNEYLTLPTDVRTVDHVKIYVGDSSFVDLNTETGYE